jgi:tripartite-type tricarboxylate transporter receptor subunit TctC
MDRKYSCIVVGTAVAGIAAGPAAAQDYPSKPIRVFASTAGGGTDLAARVIARGVASGFSQPVVVENRAAVISIETVAKAPPDGYTLIVMGVPLWLAPFMQDNVPWDPVRDFQPITTITRQPTFLVAHTSLPVKSVKELIALAKSKPGQLNYGSGGTGTSSHLSAELFQSMAGIKITRVNYKGVSQALNDLLGGQLQLMFATPGSVAPHITSGRLRALAVTSAQPSALDPALPPIARTLPGYEFVELLGFFAPAKTPAAIVQRWNQATVKVLESAELKEKFFNTGGEIVTSTPEQFAAAIKSDMTRFGKLIKEARLRGDRD